MQDPSSKRPRRDEATLVGSSTGDDEPVVPEAATRSPTSILPSKASICPRLSRDVSRRIFISDDRARRGMQDEPASPSSSSRDNTPRKPVVTRSRDLPRRVLLPDDGVPSKKKRATPVHAPVTPVRKKRKNTEDSLEVVAAGQVQALGSQLAEELCRLEPVRGAAGQVQQALGSQLAEELCRLEPVLAAAGQVQQALGSQLAEELCRLEPVLGGGGGGAAAAAEGDLIVETTTARELEEAVFAAAATQSEVIVSVEAAATAPFVPPTPASPEYFRGVVESSVQEQQVEVLAALVADSSVCSSPRTPPRSPVSTLPATPKAPVKRERPTADRLPRAGAHSIRRLDFGL